MSLTDRFQQTSLRWQICIMTGVAIIASLGTMGAIALRGSRELVTNMTLDKMMAETDSVANRMESFVVQTRADTLTIPTFPPIPGIVRCWDNRLEPGQDPEQKGSDTSIWIERLGQIVSAQMAYYPRRIRCAVYDREGAGVMKVESKGGQSKLITEGIRSVSDQPYFAAATRIRSGQVHVSPMIQDEAGNVTMHFCTPFFAGDESPDTLRGIFVIVLDGKQMLESAASLRRSEMEPNSGNNENLSIEIGDESMQLLYCSNSNVGLPFGEKGFGDLRPVRAELLRKKLDDGRYDPMQNVYSSYVSGRERGDGKSMVATHRRIFYNHPEDDSRFWFVACSEYSDTALAAVNQFANSYYLIGLMVLAGALLISFVMAGGLTSSLAKLSSAADELAGGNLDAKIPELRSMGETKRVGKLGSLDDRQTAIHDSRRLRPAGTNQGDLQCNGRRAGDHR